MITFEEYENALKQRHGERIHNILSHSSGCNSRSWRTRLKYCNVSCKSRCGTFAPCGF